MAHSPRCMLLLCTSSHADSPSASLPQPAKCTCQPLPGCATGLMHMQTGDSLLLSRPAAVAARQVVDTGDMWARKLEELVQRGIIPHPRTLGK